MIYDLIKTSSQEEFEKAVQYLEYLGAENTNTTVEDYKHYPIVVVESSGYINSWDVDACPYERYTEITIPPEFLNRRVYSKEEAMKEFNCIIL